MRRFTWALLAALLTTGLALSHAQAQAWPDLSEAPAEQGGGERDAALIVGVEDYVFAPDIQGASRNANDWYLYLTRTRQIPVGNVFLLRDGEATREALLEKADEVAARVGAGGTLWFVFIGHGAPSKDGQDGVLIGSDAQQSANSLYARSVPQRELLDRLKRGKQAGTVAVLDACFSGRGPTGDTLVAGLQPLLPVTGEVKNATILTAAASDQFAGPLPQANRPAFSYLALGALRGWGDADKDGKVTPREASNYTQDALRVLLRDRQQTPQASGPGLDIPIAFGATEAGPDLASFVVASGGGLGGGGVDGGVIGTLTPPRPLPNVGFVRIGGGLQLLGADALSNTSDVDLTYNDNTFGKQTSPTDVNLSAQSGIAPLSLQMQVTGGAVDGFGVGWGVGLAQDSSLNLEARFKDDSFVSSLTEGSQINTGVTGKVTSYFGFNSTLDFIYRTKIGRFAPYGQLGVGVLLGLMDAEFVVDGHENEATFTTVNFLLPLQGGVDVDLTDTIFAHVDYSFYILPTSSSAAQAGIGIYF